MGHVPRVLKEELVESFNSKVKMISLYEGGCCGTETLSNQLRSHSTVCAV